MRVTIGVVSDTHLHRVTGALQGIYDLYLSDKDLILHAGDVVCAEVLEFLRRKDFHGVHGNMDPPEVRELVPAKKVIEIGPYRIGLIHGSGPASGLEDRILPQFQGVDAIVYGHSHQPVCHRKGGLFLFNPGTATGYSASGRHTVGILELGEEIRGEIVML